MITLYGRTGTSSDATQMVMEELQIDYELREVGKDKDALSQLRKINPRGQLPVLEIDGYVISESAAICLTLCERASPCPLLPAAGTLERADVYRWLSFAISNLYESCLRYYYEQRFACDARAAASVKVAAKAALDDYWLQVENELARRASSPWWLNSFGLLDIYFAMLVGWHPNPQQLHKAAPLLMEQFKAVGSRPSATRLNFAQGAVTSLF